MKDKSRKSSFRPPTFVFGAFLGMHLVVGLLVAGSVMLVGRQAQADLSADESAGKCFFRSECLKKETDKNSSCDGGCDTPGVSCHCFDPKPASCRDGGGFCYEKWPAVKLSIPVGGSSVVLDLADYIGKLYAWGLGFATVVAGVMMIVGGIEWMSAISGGQVDRAKKRIFAAAIGLLLVLGAYAILNTINPDIVALRLPKIPIIKKAVFTLCTSTGNCAPCGGTYHIMKPKGAGPDWRPTGCTSVVYTSEDGEPPAKCKGCQKWSDALAQNFDLTQTCDGKSCKLAGCSASDYVRCRKPLPTDSKVSGQSCGSATGGGGDSGSGSGSGSTNSATTPAKPKSAFACLPCKKYGDSCSPGGQNDTCCGGYCGKGKCTNGELGDDCNNNDDCQSGLCQTKRFNSCSSGLTGVPCDDNDECRGGNICVGTTGLKICLPKNDYGFCDTNADCPSGACVGTIRGGITKAGAVVGAGGLGSLVAGPFGMVAAAGATAIYFKTEAYCIPPGGRGTCATNEDHCTPEIPAKYTPCIPPLDGSGGCYPPQVQITPAIPSVCGGGCPDTHYCMTKSQICSSKKDGMPCNDDADCDGYKCVDSAATIVTPLAPNGVCSDGSWGHRCDKNNQCNSGHCYTEGDYGACVTGDEDSGCDSKSGCNAGLTCDTALHKCVES